MYPSAALQQLLSIFTTSVMKHCPNYNEIVLLICISNHISVGIIAQSSVQSTVTRIQSAFTANERHSYT